MAIIRLFVDTGMRLSELTGLRVEDLDFEADVAGVLGKGRRMRACPLGNKTALALQRHLRERARRADVPSDTEGPLRLGIHGPMSPRGIAR
jgi:site-specific recombinase XerC